MTQDNPKRTRRVFCAPWEDPIEKVDRVREESTHEAVKMPRRLVLGGIGGAVLALPFLESLFTPSRAHAFDAGSSYAVFLRQANGVACAQRSNVANEPERFWPTAVGALTPATMTGRAVDELVAYRAKLLVVRNINTSEFTYGDGHARGAMQALTARGPTIPNANAAQSEAAGESLDHRIGRELNPDARDSWFFYAGQSGGYLGGASISYRSAGNRRSPTVNPQQAYRSLVGGEAGLSAAAARDLGARRRSVNDLVRTQLGRLMNHPRMSTTDRDRVELHRSAIRDLEVRLSCELSEEQERTLDGAGSLFNSTDGDVVMRLVRLQMDVAAIAIACGVTRSVAIQVGAGTDGATRYRRLDNGEQMENYHYISHRRLSHSFDGPQIANSDVLHSMVDRTFAKTFKHLLDRLSSFPVTGVGTLLDAGVAVWLNDLGDGPAHGHKNCPYVLAGSANGYLRQGQYIDASGGANVSNHGQLLNTIGTAVGLRRGDGPLDNFGDPSLPRGLLSEIVA